MSSPVAPAYVGAVLLAEGQLNSRYLAALTRWPDAGCLVTREYPARRYEFAPPPTSIEAEQQARQGGLAAHLGPTIARYDPAVVQVHACKKRLSSGIVGVTDLVENPLRRR